MGTIKRHPKFANRQQSIRYTRMSKTDIVEAFRDICQEYLTGETDQTEWMNELERRIKLLKGYRTGKFS